MKSRQPDRRQFTLGTVKLSVTAADVVAAALSIVMCAYAVARADMLSMTFDEAVTWAWHVTGDWQQIVRFRTPGEPDNNHVLFTLLAKLSVALFGLSELALRLPSLVGFVFFLAGINLILRRMVPGWWQVLGVVAVGLNPYLVDYFSIARGYGLGLGLSALGLASLLAAMCDRPGKLMLGKARAAGLLFALATLANLSFLLVLLAGIAVLWVPLLLRRPLEGAPDGVRWPPWRAAWAIGAPILPILVYLLLPLLVIGKLGLFKLGGTHGFWRDTVGSLIDGTIYESPMLVEGRWLLHGWVVATLLLGPLVLWTLWKKDDGAFAAFAIIGGMTLIVAVASVLQHWLLNVAWLEGRRGLFLIPLFLLWALALIAVPSTAPQALLIAALAAGAVVPAALCVHNLMATNLQYVRDWKFDAAARDMMVATKAWVGERRPADPVRMRTNWILAPSANFYRTTLGLESSLLPMKWDEFPGFDGPADLYYVQAHNVPAIVKFDVGLLKWSPVAETVLLEHVVGEGSRVPRPGTVQ